MPRPCARRTHCQAIRQGYLLLLFLALQVLWIGQRAYDHAWSCVRRKDTLSSHKIGLFPCHTAHDHVSFCVGSIYPSTRLSSHAILVYGHSSSCVANLLWILQTGLCSCHHCSSDTVTWLSSYISLWPQQLLCCCKPCGSFRQGYSLSYTCLPCVLFLLPECLCSSTFVLSLY